MEVAFENHRMPGPPSMLEEPGYSSVEKTLDWDRYLYVESGYSTQAPSISSYDSSSLTASPQQPPQSNPAQESAATAVVTRQFDKLGIDEICAPQTEENYEDEEEVEEEDERESNIENWMKSQDDMSKASKALPDLLKFFQDEDKLVVLEASVLLNQMSRLSIPRQVMIQLKHLVVPSVVNCLCVTKDIKTAYNLVGALYGISQQVPEGVQAIADSESALSVLIKMLESGLDSIISFAITIIHSVLTRSCTPEIKTMMRERNIVSILIMLLGRNQRDAKFLAIVVDSLYWLTHGNRDAKMLMLNMGGTQQLISLLYNHSMQYPKLILNTIRVLKLLSLCNENKNTMIEMRVIQLLANQLRQQPEPNSSSSFWREITENCLQIMRNLSSVAAQLQLAELGQWNSQLLAFISSSQEPAHIEIAAGILANFTTREPEKIAAIEANAIPIMLNLISYFSQGPQASAKIVAPSMCVLHHLTIRHSMAMFAQEQVIAYRGLPVLVAAMMSHVQKNKAVLKETIDVIYNFACNQLNFEHLKQCEVMLKLMQVLFEAVRAIEIKAATSNGQTTDIKEDGVSLTEIVKKVCETLKLLVKDNSHKKMMLDWECISFLVKTHESGLTSLRNCVKPVLEELATSPDCLRVIEAHIAALRAARPQ